MTAVGCARAQSGASTRASAQAHGWARGLARKAQAGGSWLVSSRMAWAQPYHGVSGGRPTQPNPKRRRYRPPGTPWFPPAGHTGGNRPRLSTTGPGKSREQSQPGGQTTGWFPSWRSAVRRGHSLCATSEFESGERARHGGHHSFVHGAGLRQRPQTSFPYGGKTKEMPRRRAGRQEGTQQTLGSPSRFAQPTCFSGSSGGRGAPLPYGLPKGTTGCQEVGRAYAGHASPVGRPPDSQWLASPRPYGRDTPRTTPLRSRASHTTPRTTRARSSPLRSRARPIRPAGQSPTQPGGRPCSSLPGIKPGHRGVDWLWTTGFAGDPSASDPARRTTPLRFARGSFGLGWDVVVSSWSELLRG
nr:FIG01135415: hypothetical protein [Kibdelosporangium sp. MJ126-NF4]CTQ94430.1 hypothetical protein [Kibdelosporangium sp. MJ126-NF4]